jgi:transposase
MRVVGLDVSRTVADISYLEDGRIRAGGRVELQHAPLQTFARRLLPTDEVVLEATGNTQAIVALLKAHVAKVIVANPLQVRLIAEAKVKTDKIDAAVLAQLYASGFLPEVWIPDADTQALRRQAARRAQIVRQRTRLKNEIHSVLAAHLVPKSPAADLFGRKGRAWLAQQPLPLDERLGVEQRLRELDRLGEDLTAIERQLGDAVLEDARVHQLLSITGVNATVAIGRLAAIGDVTRFRSPQKLVSYFGLNPVCVSIGAAAGQAWPHQQAWPLPRPGHAGRSRVGSGEIARPAARVLPENPRAARPADRRSGHRAQARGSRLACAQRQ